MSIQDSINRALGATAAGLKILDKSKAGTIEKQKKSDIEKQTALNTEYAKLNLESKEFNLETADFKNKYAAAGELARKEVNDVLIARKILGADYKKRIQILKGRIKDAKETNSK